MANHSWTHRVFLLQLLLVAASIRADAVSSADKRFLFQGTDSLWGPWSSYGECSVTCDVGTKTRHRECFVRSPSSSVCTGSSTETQACSLQACPVVNNQSPCADVYPDCQQVDSTQGVCTKFPDWARTNCNKYCGFCHVAVPNVHTCSDAITTCDLYTHTVCRNYTAWATRNCNKFCGFCQPVPTVTTKPFTINGGWTTWSDLTSCSVTCGTGVVQRMRTCSNPTPSSGGAFCQGNASEKYVCNPRPCLNTGGVNGGWSAWSDWSRCSVTCYFGVQSRDRSCTNPSPSGGGVGCQGNRTESQVCSLGPCAGWTHWFDGACSAGCGGQGQRERLRHCSTGHDNDCQGNAYEIVPCSGQC